MNKIRLTANREAGFVYHMLSVARCGYDNAYGEKYRGDYPAEVLQALKKHEDLIKVSGGEHCGALYGLMVAMPAQDKGCARDFYLDLIRQVDENEVPEWGLPYAPAAREIAAAMAICYDHYVADVWPLDLEEIQAYIAQTAPLFEQSDFTARAEEAVGCVFPADEFYAVLVPSIQGGPEAIDISKDQDIFGMGRPPEDAFLFIAHEFIIYLLKRALESEDAFRRMDTWSLTEGLAEYYLRRILGKTNGSFSGQQSWVEFYQAQSGAVTAVELYRRALAEK